MPWCEPCAKYFAPSALTSDGECPECRTAVDTMSVSGRINVDTLDLKKLAGVDGDKHGAHGE
jgi:Zn finger protein HypA/HybF involved in hydrogenase expression